MNPRRRGGWLALAALVLVGLPEVAHAQLFPNLPIRRERPPCELEPPEFRQIRHLYYGYYPTCWRKFPPGWGCPVADRVDIEALKQDIQRQATQGAVPGMAQPGGEAPMNPEGVGIPVQPTEPAPGDEMAPPPRSEERSPFRIDQGPGRRNAVPRPSPDSTTPGTGEPVTPPATTPGNDAATPVPAPGAPAPGPGLDAPAGSPTSSAAGSSGGPVAILDMGSPSSPVPPAALNASTDSLPFPAPPEASSPGPVPPAPGGGAPASPAASMPVASDPGTLPPPAIQAPPRRRLLGGLFQNLGIRRR